MNKSELMSVNRKYIYITIFILVLANALISFFLPFYLKENGWNILQIGAVFTISMAVGSLLFSIFYARILKNIQLKHGYTISASLAFLFNFIFFIFPTYLGSFISKFIYTLKRMVQGVSSDVSLQHNSTPKNHRSVFSFLLIYDSLAQVVGIVLAITLITLLGFPISALIFAILTLSSFFFFRKISDKSRFKIKKIKKIPKTSFNLKLMLFSEILYWFALASSFSLVITFLVSDRFSGSMAWIGILFIGLYASIVLTTLLTYKRLNKSNLLKTSIFGMLILTFSAVLVIISNNLYFVLGAMVLEGIGAGIWAPSKGAVYWKLVGPESRERMSGFLNGWRTLVSTLGPLFGGFLVSTLGILAPFYFKTVASLFIILVYIYVLKKYG